MDIARIDLNLLVALQALLDERSVTRAGRRIGLSQPAMSGALARLRAVLGDPLFVRSSRGMLPTPRALRLGAGVGPLLGKLGEALDADATFDEASATRRFTLAASDHAMTVVLPDLVARLATSAPGVTLRVVAMSDHRPPADMEAGGVDLALGVFRSLPAGYRRRVLLRDELVSLVRKGHPTLGARPTLREYAAASHILISPQGKARGAIDVALERHKKTRRIAVLVPNLAGAAVLLGRSDLVLTVGARVAAPLVRPLGLRVVRPPLKLSPIEICLVWHERNHRDPAHAWLRHTISELG